MEQRSHVHIQSSNMKKKKKITVWRNPSLFPHPYTSPPSSSRSTSSSLPPTPLSPLSTLSLRVSPSLTLAHSISTLILSPSPPLSFDNVVSVCVYEGVCRERKLREKKIFTSSSCSFLFCSFVEWPNRSHFSLILQLLTSHLIY
jgi:hypothetical protein